MPLINGSEQPVRRRRTPLLETGKARFYAQQISPNFRPEKKLLKVSAAARISRHNSLPPNGLAKKDFSPAARGRLFQREFLRNSGSFDALSIIESAMFGSCPLSEVVHPPGTGTKGDDQDTDRPNAARPHATASALHVSQETRLGPGTIDPNRACTARRSRLVSRQRP